MNTARACYKILVITELFLPTKGGTAVWFDEVYRRIAGKGIHIVTADVPGAVEYDRTHPNSIHRISLRRSRWLRPESLAMYLNLLGKVLGLALSNRFDAVHAGRVLPEGLVGLIAARLIRRPLAIYAHGEEITTWRQPAKFRTMVLVYRHADCIIANSKFTRNELLKLGVNQERIALIFPGVDTERFRPGLKCNDLRVRLGLSGGQKLILSVGRLSRRKGFDQVIRALPLLAERGIDIRYAVIGTGADREYLDSLARELGVDDRVQLLGQVSVDDLPRWYNAADVFAMPNRDVNNDTEGFGLVYLEAAACGKPALAGTAGGTGSAVVDGVTGLCVDGTSIEAVASGLARLLEDGEFARKMGENGMVRARAEFSWDSVARKTMNIRI